jgi:hypothetical protein
VPRPDAEQALLEAPPRARRWIAPAVGASLALHGAAIAALVWFVADEASPPRPGLVPVEIIAVAAPEPAAEPGAAESAVNSPNVETGETSEQTPDPIFRQLRSSPRIQRHPRANR